jgi:death on curing protein
MSFDIPAILEEVFFPELEDIIAIHENALETGGSPGMLKEVDLLGAVGRPFQAAQYDSDADLITIAAYYWHGISMSHGFVDGNKRTGLLTAIAFLEVNGIEFNADEDEPGELINTWMADGDFELPRLDTYLRERCVA